MRSRNCSTIAGHLPPRLLLVVAITALLAAGCGSMSADVQPDDTTPGADERGEADEPTQPDTEPPQSQMSDESSKSSMFDDLFDETRDVVVATTDIEAGAPLRKSDVTSKDVPAEFLPANPLLEDDVRIYLGQPLAEDIEKGAMILTGDFVVAETGTNLAHRIPDGERALTIPSDSVGGDMVLIEPGDRVDILGTFPTDDDDMVTLSLLQNVTVLATGSCLSDIDDTCDPDGDVAVSVTPDEAELLTVTRSRGELTMLLRNREDMETAPVTRRSLREVLEQLDVIQRERDERVDDTPPESGHDDDISITR